MLHSPKGWKSEQMLAGFTSSKGSEGKSVPCLSPTFGHTVGHLRCPRVVNASPRSLPSSFLGVLLVCVSVSKFLLFIRIVCAHTQSCLATLWNVAHQAPLSMRFSRQGHWSVLPFPHAGDLPDPGIEPVSPALQADSLPTEPSGKPLYKDTSHIKLGLTLMTSFKNAVSKQGHLLRHWARTSVCLFGET